MSFRVDKFIWCVRLAKTRSKATELIVKGRVRLNDAAIKPAREVNIGDVIQITKHTATYSFKVLQLLEKRVGAKLVKDFILDITPQEEVEKHKLYQLTQSTYRSYGTGKPSKKDRRDLDDFLEDWD